MHRIDKIVAQQKSNGYRVMATWMYSNTPDITLIDPNIDLVSAGICDPIVGWS
jgi:hypothetical protein